MVGATMVPGLAVGLATKGNFIYAHLVPPARRATAWGIETMTSVPRLLLDGMDKWFITLNAVQNSIFHVHSPPVGIPLSESECRPLSRRALFSKDNAKIDPAAIGYRAFPQFDRLHRSFYPAP
jgi:hypothetical protein